MTFSQRIDTRIIVLQLVFPENRYHIETQQSDSQQEARSQKVVVVVCEAGQEKTNSFLNNS